MSINKSKIISLVATAYADGIFDIQELHYINKKAEMLDLEKDELLKIIQNPHINDPIYPTLEVEKLEFMYDIMELMLADSVISDSEVTIFKSYLLKLGFEGDTEELREMMRKSVVNKQNFNQFKENNYPQI